MAGTSPWAYIIPAAADLLGGALSQQEANQASQQDYEQAKEFAQMGVRWRVADARAAGISPLVAMGANIASPPATNVGGGMGEALSRMGQDVSRAIRTSEGPVERALNALTIERGTLENELLRTRLMREKSAQLGPGGPVDLQPAKRTMEDPGNPAAEAGGIPGVAYERGPYGNLVPIPSQGVAENIEDNWLHQGRHFISNTLFGGPKPSASLLPAGYDDWVWSGPMDGWWPTKNGVRMMNPERR